MRINYRKFADNFAASGLTRKAYGAQQGISPNMVSYYLKRAKMQEEQVGSFKKLEIIPSTSQNAVIRIYTSQGLTIEIPA